MRCLWLVLWLLVGAPGVAMAEDEPVLFRTEPTGATITQHFPHSPDVLLGKSGTSVVVRLPADANQSVNLEFSLPDYQPVSKSIPTFVLQHGSQYPQTVVLQPASAGVVLKLWVQDHWLVVTGVLLALAGSVLGLVRWLLGLRDMHEQTVVRPSQATLQVDRVGTTLAGYHLVERLGEGGTAEVYLAQPAGDAAIPPVAIKVIRNPSGATTARFQREVEILRRLQHPHIVQLLDWGDEAGVLYLVEELVANGSLAQRIPARGMSVDEFIRLFRAILAGVGFAHAHGIVHRDLKPDNVLMTDDLQPKVSDFGLAKTEAASNLTTSNMMGTPAYMAPEQFSGLPATPLSDQFTLGVMAYQMVSGKLPFQGDSVAELMARRLQPPPPVSIARGATIPSQVELVIMRMLERRPEERFADVQAALDALG